jgi:hypothetical protein
MRLHSISALLLTAMMLVSCAEYSHRYKHELNLIDAAQTQADGDVEVSVAVLSAEQSSALFGTFVAETGVQPVWVRIRNNEPDPYWFFSVSLDPDYYSPHEAAWKNHLSFGGYSNVKMDSNFRRQAIYPYIPAGETVSGFVYTRRDEGVKQVTIDLKRPGSEGKSFYFILPVPGFDADIEALDLAAHYAPDEIVHLHTEAALREWIEKLPCCVFGEDGETPGDPLNLVIIGHPDAVDPAFLQRGWELAESAHLGAIWKMVKSSLFGAHYRYSPVSPLYLFGRKQDLALQKARETIDERNHLRLWLAPATFKGMPVRVGQISRDIGVRLTGRLSPPTTHVIDPEVDEARWYLEQDLALSQHVSHYGLASGVGYAPEQRPRQNLLGDPYYTDGLRLVAIFTEDPTSFSQIQDLGWETPTDIRVLSRGAE